MKENLFVQEPSVILSLKLSLDDRHDTNRYYIESLEFQH